MKSIYIKILHVFLILIFLVNIAFIASPSSNSVPQTSAKQRILAIYTPDTLNLVNTLYHDRQIINPSQLSITLKNLDNTTQLNSLLSNHPLSQSYDEFWIITESVKEYQPQMNQIMAEILSYNLPTLIWSSNLQDLNNSILTKIGITSCNSDPIQNDYGLLSFDYSNLNNLSTLLNVNNTFPSLQTFSSTIDYANCSLNQNDYSILNLASAGSNTFNPSIPILFQPHYKSNILVSSFYYQNSTQDSTNTTTSIMSMTTTTSTSTDTSTSDPTTLNAFLYQQSKISQVNQITVANLISTLTYSNLIDWAYSPAVSSVMTNGFSSSGSGTGGQTLQILQTGFQFPNIDPKLVQNIATGSLIVALLGAFILLLRRYWLIILSAFIGIFAVFKVPSRKISMMDVYHNETRQNIIDHLNFRKSQGETVRNLSRELEIPLPTLLWHLQILEEFELIVKEKVKREIVVISMDYVDDFNLELKIFEMTFKSDKAKIFYDYLLNLQKGQIFTITSVVTHTSWSTRTVIRYISKLLELQIIEQNPIGKGYKITEDYFTKLQELN